MLTAKRAILVQTTLAKGLLKLNKKSAYPYLWADALLSSDVCLPSEQHTAVIASRTTAQIDIHRADGNELNNHADYRQDEQPFTR